MLRTEPTAGTCNVTLEVDPALRIYITGAAARLSYTEPDLEIRAYRDSLVAVGPDLDERAVRRLFNHALYREKIAAEGTPLRARLLELLGRR